MWIRDASAACPSPFDGAGVARGEPAQQQDVTCAVPKKGEGLPGVCCDVGRKTVSESHWQATSPRDVPIVTSQTKWLI